MECGLHEKNVALTEEAVGVNEEIAKLNARIIVEHEEGFYKALRQATVLLKVHEPFDVGFEIDDGELVHLGPLVLSENPADPANVEPEGVPAGMGEAEAKAVMEEEADEEVDEWIGISFEKILICR